MGKALAGKAVRNKSARSQLVHFSGYISGINDEIELEYLRSSGESGQLIVGLKAGLTLQEIMDLREWTPAQLAQYSEDAKAVIKEMRNL